MKKIKIAYVIDIIDGPWGGTEKQLLLLLEHLDRGMFEPWLCCLRAGDWIRRNSPCPVYELGFRSFLSPGTYLKLFRFYRFLKEKKFDIVQTFSRDGRIAGVLAGRLARADAVIDTRRNFGHWYTKRELLIVKVLNRFCNAFIVNSVAVKERTMEKEGIPGEKVHVVYNGIDFDGVRENALRNGLFRERIGLDIDGPVVVSVANLRAVKRLDVLLKAAAEVLSKFPSAHFLLIGEGPEEGELSRLSDSLDIKERVHFAGKRGDVGDLLAGCSIGVLSSDSEGLSNAIMEYMTAGLPVVCTDVGGNGELVRDGENGFLVPSGDYGRMAGAIQRLLEDGGLSLRMGENSRHIAEGFGLKECVRKTEALYLELLENRKGHK